MQQTGEDDVSEKFPPTTEEFPEGGGRGWLTLLGAALIQFTTFGYTNAFGVYQGDNQDFYVREYLTNYTASDIGWIGGVQTFLILSCGMLTGRAFDRGYFYHLMIAGTLLQSFSYFMLSISHERQYYQVFLSQGIGSGLASGIVYIPSLSIVSHYFLRRRPVAMGVVTIGAAIGTIVHSIMLNHLFYGSVGFHNGVRISAAMNTVLMAFAILIMRTRLPPKQASVRLPIMEFFREPAYLLCIIGSPFFLCGFTFPFFYLQLDAITHGVDPNLAFYYISVLTAVSILGRFLGTVFVPKLGGFNLLVGVAAAMSVVVFALGAIKTTGTFFAFSALFGFFSGGGNALIPPVLASLARDMSELGARIGIVYAFGGIGGLISTPIAGALLGSRFAWWPAVIFEGVTLAVAAAIWFCARMIISRKKGSQLV